MAAWRTDPQKRANDADGDQEYARQPPHLPQKNATQVVVIRDRYETMLVIMDRCETTSAATTAKRYGGNSMS
jgi:hypothetical protein